MSIIDPFIPRIIIDNDQFVCSGVLKKTKIPLKEIRWAYLQKEDARVTMCCYKSGFVISRLIIRTKDRKYSFELYDEQDVRDALEKLRAHNPLIVIGYKSDFEEIFQKDYGEFLRVTRYYF